MDAIGLRGLERILAVLIGGLAIYLGYRLFARIPENRDAEGKFTFPGGFSIYVARVGPGVFFALFGAVVIGLSFRYAVTYESGQPSYPAALGGTERFIGATPVQGRGAGPRQPVDIKLEVAFLNGLPERLREDLPEFERREARRHITRIKLALLELVWPEDWEAEFVEFREWVEAGARDPVPASLGEAAAYYRTGQVSSE